MNPSITNEIQILAASKNGTRPGGAYGFGICRLETSV
jgi:hypothetical protein